MTPLLKNGTGTYSDDLEFLKKHTDVIELIDGTGESRVAIVAAMQGRVMTSTAEGLDGQSFGWINRELIESGEFVEHINVFGGEDRFWIGPEGGQFSVFFKKGDPFDLEHWQTPAAIDTETYEVARKTGSSVLFTKRFNLKNYSDYEFRIEVQREVRLISASNAWSHLRLEGRDDLKITAFETDNRIMNVGRGIWNKKTGLLSIWILGMLKHSPDTTVIIPIRKGDPAQLGPEVNSDYFGKVPDDRLQVKDGMVYFKADGQYRSKIGISPARALPIAGSYDPSAGVMTIIQFSFDPKAKDYVNSMWELQEEPYGGDVINSYNDGPPAPGKEPLGPFYELETSSAARELRPGEKITHIHRTFHIVGDKPALDELARKIFGVSLDTITEAL